MKNLSVVLILCSLFLSLDYISETYDDGTPKIVKAYRKYGSTLGLVSETGYYIDGQMEYQKKYRNEELVSTSMWNKDGSKASSRWNKDIKKIVK